MDYGYYNMDCDSQISISILLSRILLTFPAQNAEGIMVGK